MVALSVAVSDFGVSPAALEITADVSGPSPSTATAGGVWEGTGRRAGHQVCWRILGTALELSETSLLPGVALRDAERRIQFPRGLLPALGVAQLADDALVVTIAMHAPPGGVTVYQLHFALPADPPLVQCAVTTVDSWFAATPASVPATPEPVGVSLGTALTVAFDSVVEAAGRHAWRTSMLLGGEAAHPVHVGLLLDLERPTAGILAVEAPVRPPRAPAARTRCTHHCTRCCAHCSLRPSRGVLGRPTGRQRCPSPLGSPQRTSLRRPSSRRSPLAPRLSLCPPPSSLAARTTHRLMPCLCRDAKHAA